MEVEEETALIKTETADGGPDMVNVGRIQALCWLRARKAAVSVEGGKKISMYVMWETDLEFWIESFFVLGFSKRSMLT